MVPPRVNWIDLEEVNLNQRESNLTSPTQGQPNVMRQNIYNLTNVASLQKPFNLNRIMKKTVRQIQNVGFFYDLDLFNTLKVSVINRNKASLIGQIHFS